MAGLCKIEHDPGQGVCGLPLQPGSSRYCYWGRLERTNRAGQMRLHRERVDLSGPEFMARYVGAFAVYWTCNHCGKFAPEWYRTSGRRCKGCQSLISADRRVERVYGATPADIKALKALQGQRCGICGCSARTIELAVDHDHQTGEVRGLLCSNCNHKGLGGFFDSLRRVRNAVRYLENPPASGRWEGRIE